MQSRFIRNFLNYIISKSTFKKQVYRKMNMEVYTSKEIIISKKNAVRV